MCFPVYKKLDGKNEMVAVYTDFAKLQEDWNVKFGEGFFWEPWPVNMTFSEGTGFF